jgi:hypothetical protein
MRQKKQIGRYGAWMVLRALVQIGELGRVHWSFGELRARGEQVEQHRRVVSRAALRP